MYHLSVKANGEMLRKRVPYADYAEAVAACGEYYEPRAPGSVLSFTSVVTRKRFMRSYAQLIRMEDLGSDVPGDSPQSIAAVKQNTAFSFSRSYVFLIESDDGVREAEQWAREDDE
jgi:hypothetical protein